MRFVLVMLCSTAVAGCLTSSAVGLSRDEFAADCAAETYTASDRPTKIRCGVRKDHMSFSLWRPKDERIEEFKQELEAWGRGAVGPFRCGRREEAVRCAGRKEGPVKVQRWITVAGARCAGRSIVSSYVSKPVGCPGVRPSRPHWNLRHLRNERQEFGFDADLNGDQAAITRRIQGIIRGGGVKPKKRSGWTHFSGTCAGATEIDYEAPLAGLPPLPRNTARDGLDIGPPDLRLVGAGSSISIGRGRFGYRLLVNRQVIHRPVFLDGYTEFEFDRINREGDVVETVAAKRQRLGVVASPAFNGKSFLVRVPAKPGLYRFQARLRDAQGGAVGRYADYLRVVRPVTDVRLVTSGGPIGPGSRVDFWIENRGTREVDPLGAEFAFEVFEGGAWSKAPGSPRVFPKFKYMPLRAGEAGACSSFQVPSEAKPGLYRLSKDVVLESGARRQLTSEFEVSSS